MSQTNLGYVVIVAACAVALAGCSDGPGGGSAAVDQWTMLGYDHESSYTNHAQTKLARDNAQQLGAFWEFEARGTVYGTPVVVDGVVYTTSTGGLYALDGASGAVLWQVLDYGATSSLAYRDGTLFVHDLGGFLHALDAATGQEKWRTRTDGPRRTEEDFAMTERPARRPEAMLMMGAGIGVAWHVVREGGVASASAVSCVLSPEQIERPFYVAGEPFRRDIAEGGAGLPLRLELRLRNAATCRWIKGATVGSGTLTLGCRSIPDERTAWPS